MSLNGITRALYVTFGVIYLVIGIGSMLLPAGLLPGKLGAEYFPVEMQTPYGGHLLQEIGTVFIGLGLLLLWFATQRERHAGFHWLVTVHMGLMAFVHIVGPDGLTSPGSRWVITSIPLVIWLTLGILHRRRRRP